MKKILGKIECADLILSAAGVLALAALFVRWRVQNPGTSAAGVWAAFFSAALFAVFGVRLVRGWMDQWRAVRAEGFCPAIYEPVRPAVLIKIALCCLAAEAAALLTVFVFQTACGGRQNLLDALHIWERFDSQHYLDIARYWYLSDAGLDRVVQLVFLPGYPLLIRLFHLLVGDWLAAAFVASWLSFAGAGVMLYLLARLDTDHEGALRALKYTLILPGAFFFAAPMSEGLFFLLSVSCLYCVRRGRFLSAGVLGGLAAFTRSLGIVLLVPAAYTLITSMVAKKAQKAPSVRRRIGQALALLLIPAGFGAYCLVCRSISGDAFKFLEYQRDHWGQSAGLFFSTAAYQTENALRRFTEGDMGTMMGLWVSNLACSFGALIVMALAARRLRPVYSVYFFAYYAVAIGTTWLLSAPRYLLACAPLSLALGRLTEDRRTDGAVTVLLTALYMLYAFFMANRWQVW